MAQKPITSSFTLPGPDRANIKSIEKNFNELYNSFDGLNSSVDGLNSSVGELNSAVAGLNNSLKWKELLNTEWGTNVATSTFTLPNTWQQIQNAYAEVYFCVRGLENHQHTIIVPTDMINKPNASSIFYLAGSNNNSSMILTIGSLIDKTGTIRSSSHGSTRLIILAR